MPKTARPDRGDLVVAPVGDGHVILRAGTPNVPIIAEADPWSLDHAIAFAATRAHAQGVDVWLARDAGASYERVIRLRRS
jgi:hypothetical protein